MVPATKVQPRGRVWLLLAGTDLFPRHVISFYVFHNSVETMRKLVQSALFASTCTASRISNIVCDNRFNLGPSLATDLRNIQAALFVCRLGYLICYRNKKDNKAETTVRLKPRSPSSGPSVFVKWRADFRVSIEFFISIDSS